jgi:hypothetical protein
VTQEQHAPADWMISNARDVVGASARQVKETNKASLDASRAVMRCSIPCESRRTSTFQPLKSTFQIRVNIAPNTVLHRP